MGQGSGSSGAHIGCHPTIQSNMSHVCFIEFLAKDGSDTMNISVPDGEKGATQAMGAKKFAPKLDGSE